MIYINEWLPNPAGTDGDNEFIELYNSGSTPVDLSGWGIVTEKGKKFILPKRTIAPKSYLNLKKSETKLSLRNTDGGLFLRDASGKTIDRGSFYGSAPEGKSFSRVEYSGVAAFQFSFAEPSPGAPNRAVKNELVAERYPVGVPLRPARLDAGGFFGIMIGSAALIAGLIIYVIHTNDEISQLFFGGDAGDR